MELGWPLPEQHSHYLSKPVSYLSHLFGHEGSGSILSLLKVCCCGCVGTSYKCARLIGNMVCACVSDVHPMACGTCRQRVGRWTCQAVK